MDFKPYCMRNILHNMCIERLYIVIRRHFYPPIKKCFVVNKHVHNDCVLVSCSHKSVPIKITVKGYLFVTQGSPLPQAKHSLSCCHLYYSRMMQQLYHGIYLEYPLKIRVPCFAEVFFNIKKKKKKALLGKGNSLFEFYLLTTRCR